MMPWPREWHRLAKPKLVVRVRPVSLKSSKEGGKLSVEREKL